MPEIELDELTDHDLLVRIATQIECLPELKARVRAVELEIARMKQWAGVMAALVMGVATVIATVLSSLLS